MGLDEKGRGKRLASPWRDGFRSVPGLSSKTWGTASGADGGVQRRAGLFEKQPQIFRLRCASLKMTGGVAEGGAMTSGAAEVARWQ